MPARALRWPLSTKVSGRSLVWNMPCLLLQRPMRAFMLHLGPLRWASGPGRGVGSLPGDESLGVPCQHGGLGVLGGRGSGAGAEFGVDRAQPRAPRAAASGGGPWAPIPGYGTEMLPLPVRGPHIPTSQPRRVRRMPGCALSPKASPSPAAGRASLTPCPAGTVSGACTVSHRRGVGI